MDGEDATAGEFEERLKMLKAIGEPIFFRLALAPRENLRFLLARYLYLTNVFLH